VAYSRLTVVAGVLAAMAISIVVSIQAVQQTQREGELRQRQAVCAVADRMVKVYSTPSTQTGREAGEAWQQLRMLFRCQGGTP